MSGAWSASYALHANILKCIKVHWFCKNPVVRVFIQCPNCALGYNAYRRILSMMHWCCLSRSCDPTLAMPKTSPDHPWGLHLSARMSLLFLPYLWAPIFWWLHRPRLLNTGETSTLACHTLAALQTGSIWEPWGCSRMLMDVVTANGSSMRFLEPTI